MTYYILSPGQVRNILEMMGYEVGDDLELMESMRTLTVNDVKRAARKHFRPDDLFVVVVR